AVNAPRGEFVLVMAGAEPPQEISMTRDDAVKLAKQWMQAGDSASTAAKKAAAQSTFSKSEIYKHCL
ncbi:MAG: 16S rRNA (cytidine(1402)-2'-O)-methyltransferase, partial [Ruthenibacterium sp.]